MKSAYELTLERLSQQSPTRKLTAKQKAQLAELDSIYQTKLAQNDLGSRDELARAEAAGDAAKVEAIRTEFAAQKRKLEAELEEKKERIRSES